MAQWIKYLFVFLLLLTISFSVFASKANQLYTRNPATDSVKKPGYFEWKKIKKTPYIKNLLSLTQYPGYLKNAGLTHSINPKKAKKAIF